MNEMKRYYSFFTSQPGDWRPCSKEHHDMVRANPQDWPGYEVRELAVIPEGHVVVSEGLLRRVCAEQPATCCMDDEMSWRRDRDSALIELRALLNEEKENGNG